MKAALTVNLESDLVGDGLRVRHDRVLGAALQLLADVLHRGREGQHAHGRVAVGGGLECRQVQGEFLPWFLPAAKPSGLLEADSFTS